MTTTTKFSVDIEVSNSGSVGITVKDHAGRHLVSESTLTFQESQRALRLAVVENGFPPVLRERLLRGEDP